MILFKHIILCIVLAPTDCQYKTIEIHFINKLLFLPALKWLFFQRRGDGNYSKGGIRGSHSDNCVNHVVQQCGGRTTRCLISINLLYELRLYVRYKTDLSLHIGQILAFYFDTTPYTLRVIVNTKSV